MLTFLRKIRRSLVESRSARKYLIYAVGEIALVVVGILIALQINNWNEAQKDRVLEKVILQDLYEDLHQDSLFLSQLLFRYRQQITNYKLLDSSFQMPEIIQIPLKDSIILYNRLFNRPPSFRTFNGTYTSILMDGRSNLLKNKTLLEKIQYIYEFRIPAINSIYGDLKEKERIVISNRLHEIEEIIRKKGLEDADILVEMRYLYASIQAYCYNMMLLQEKIKEVLGLIRGELVE